MVPWIEELENRDWLIEHSEELLAFYGDEPFWADEPVPLKGDWVSLQKTDAEAAAHAVMESWIQELGLPFEGMTVAAMDQPGIFFEVQNNEVHFDVNEWDLGHPVNMPAVLALALAGLFISLKRPDEGQGWHEDEEMPITTLVAILLGFGPFICAAQQGAENLPESESSTASESEESGPLPFDSGLSLKECCFAQAYVSFIFEQDFTAFQSLFPECRDLVADALGYMMQLEEQSRD